jgi:hypothetical protein
VEFVVTCRKDSIRLANKLSEIGERRRSADRHAEPIVLTEYLEKTRVLAAYESYKTTGKANLENFQPIIDDDDDIPAELMEQEVIEILDDDDEASNPVCFSPSFDNLVDQDEIVKKEVIDLCDSDGDDEVLPNRKTKRNHDDEDEGKLATKIFAGIFSINHILPFSLLGDAQLSNNNNNNNNSNNANANANNSGYVVPSSIDDPPLNSDAQSKGPVRLKLLSPGSTKPGMSRS